MRALEVDETHLVALDPVENETMSVTVIDANHCPGAVMYIFEVRVKCCSGLSTNFVVVENRQHNCLLWLNVRNLKKQVSHLTCGQLYLYCWFPASLEAHLQLLYQWAFILN